jgi:copper(I)-binding protein
MIGRAAVPLLVTGILAILTGACAERPGGRAADLATAGDLSITRAVIPAPVTVGDRQAALYMTIRNNGIEPDILTALSAPVADSVTLHTMEQVGGMMRMVPMGPLPIPAGQNTILEPGQRHAMLEGLHRQLEVGDTIRIMVRFANAGETEVAVPVVAYDQIGDVR